MLFPYSGGEISFVDPTTAQQTVSSGTTTGSSNSTGSIASTSTNSSSVSQLNRRKRDREESSKDTGLEEVRNQYASLNSNTPGLPLSSFDPTAVTTVTASSSPESQPMIHMDAAILDSFFQFNFKADILDDSDDDWDQLLMSLPSQDNDQQQTTMMSSVAVSYNGIQNVFSEDDQMKSVDDDALVSPVQVSFPHLVVISLWLTNCLSLRLSL